MNSLCNIQPSKLVKQISSIHELQRSEYIEKFRGEIYMVEGLVYAFRSFEQGYNTVTLMTTDQVMVACNFDLSISDEVKFLEKDENVKIVGQIFNISDQLIVIDHSALIQSEDDIKDYIADVSLVGTTKISMKDRLYIFLSSLWMCIRPLLKLFLGILVTLFTMYVTYKMGWS